jgi:hypothetical protein
MATGLHSLESWLQPYAVQLVNIAAAAGLAPRVASARRSHSQQALLYRRFLAGQSRFPAAPPGNSSHELGLAFDLWINDESQFDDLGTVWEGWGGTWGGRFRDPIHFEAPRDNGTGAGAVPDPGIRQPEFVDQLNTIMNTAASFALPGYASAAEFGASLIPKGVIPASGPLRDAATILTDPMAAIEMWPKDVADWILRTYKRF